MEEKNEISREEQKKRSQAMQKRLVRILICIFGAAVLVIGVAVAVALLTKPDETPVEYGEEFFYPTYQGDIMQYESYLELDRKIQYCADPSGQGMTTSIEDDNEDEFPASVLFLRDYIQTVIAGDVNAYNAMFNEAYYEENEPQKPFSPQMIYRTRITYRLEQMDGEDKMIAYWLEYMIFENDGSFRRDIASNASRRQNVVLRIKPDGTITIEELTTVYIQ